MTPGVFVTATGTEVGKTYVSCGLIRACLRAGRAVAALKPVASGFEPDAPEVSDTGALLQALGRVLTPSALAEVSPWRFRAPLSPDMAARLESRVLSLDEIAQACRAALTTERFTVVEGVGGVMVPLGGGRTVLDLVAALDLPVLLVSPTGLGALSHLLTALTALEGRGLVPRAIVLSESVDSSVPLSLTLDTLRDHGWAELLFVLRRAEPQHQEPIFDAILARLLEAPLPARGAD